MIRAFLIAVALAGVLMVVAVIVPASTCSFSEGGEFSGAFDGQRSWVFLRRWGPGVEWVNVELSEDLPVQPGEAVIDHLPAWARPPAVKDTTEVFRQATLAVGWPWPWLTRQWVDDGGTRTFPTPAMLEEDRRPIERACWMFLNEPDLGSMGIVGMRASLTLVVWAVVAMIAVGLFVVWRRRAAKKTPPVLGRGR